MLSHGASKVNITFCPGERVAERAEAAQDILSGGVGGVLVLGLGFGKTTT